MEALDSEAPSQKHAHDVKSELVEVVRKAATVPFDDQLRTLAARYAEERGSRLIRDITSNRRKAVAEIIARGIDEGWSKDQSEKRIRDTVGLSIRDTRAVENFRQGQIAAGVSLSKVNERARAYSRRLRTARAALIVDHEARQAIADAQRALWADMRQNDQVTPYAVRVTKGQADVRKCATCKRENGRKRSLKTKQGGPPFHPRCRCWEELVDKGIKKSAPLMKSWEEVSVMERVDRVVISKPEPVTKAMNSISPGGRPADSSPLAKPGYKGPRRLPDYIRMVAHALIRSGKPKKLAIPMAIGIVKNWAQGKGDVRPQVRAAAAKAYAEFRALAKANSVTKFEKTSWNLQDYVEISKQLSKDGYTND